MRSVTKYKLNKIVKRNIEVRKSQAIAKVQKQAKLKLKTELENLERLSFVMSHPVERLTKGPTLEYTRHVENVQRALLGDLNAAREQEFRENKDAATPTS